MPRARGGAVSLEVGRPLLKALVKLHAERKRIDHQIEVIQRALRALASGGRGGAARPKPRARRRRRRMSPAARKALSQRMKAYWAKRRAQATKGKGKGEA
jgi:hypothetical protein